MDLSAFQQAMGQFNALDPGAVFVHHVDIFVSIGQAGPAGTTYRDLEERHGLSNAAVSRSVNAMSEFARHRKVTLGLVEIFRDVDEGRRYRVRLTQRGQQLYRNLEQL